MNSLISLALFIVVMLAKGWQVTGYDIYSVPVTQIDEHGSAKIVCSFYDKSSSCHEPMSCGFALYYGKDKSPLDLRDTSKYSIEVERTSVFMFLYDHPDKVKDDVVRLAQSHDVDLKDTSNLACEVKMVTIKNAKAGRYRCQVHDKYNNAEITVLPSSDTLPSQVIRFEHFGREDDTRFLHCIVMGGNPIWKISLNDWITWKSGNITAQSELVSESILFYDRLPASTSYYDRHHSYGYAGVGTVTCEVTGSVAKSVPIYGFYSSKDYTSVEGYLPLIWLFLIIVLVPTFALIVIVGSILASVRAKVSSCCTRPSV